MSQPPRRRPNPVLIVEVTIIALLVLTIGLVLLDLTFESNRAAVCRTAYPFTPYMEN